MKRLGRWLFALVLLVALLLGFLFNFENPSPVTVTLIGVVLPEFRLGLWLVIMLLLGVILGFAVSTLPAIAARRRLSRMARQNTRLVQEVQTLRSQSLRD